MDLKMDEINSIEPSFQTIQHRGSLLVDFCTQLTNNQSINDSFFIKITEWVIDQWKIPISTYWSYVNTSMNILLKLNKKCIFSTILKIIEKSLEEKEENDSSNRQTQKKSLSEIMINYLLSIFSIELPDWFYTSIWTLFSNVLSNLLIQEQSIYSISLYEFLSVFSKAVLKNRINLNKLSFNNRLIIQTDSENAENFFKEYIIPKVRNASLIVMLMDIFSVSKFTFKNSQNQHEILPYSGWKFLTNFSRLHMDFASSTHFITCSKESLENSRELFLLLITFIFHQHFISHSTGRICSYNSIFPELQKYTSAIEGEHTYATFNQRTTSTMISSKFTSFQQKRKFLLSCLSSLIVFILKEFGQKSVDDFFIGFFDNLQTLVHLHLDEKEEEDNVDIPPNNHNKVIHGFSNEILFIVEHLNHLLSLTPEVSVSIHICQKYLSWHNNDNYDSNLLSLSTFTGVVKASLPVYCGYQIENLIISNEKNIQFTSFISKVFGNDNHFINNILPIYLKNKTTNVVTRNIKSLLSLLNTASYFPTEFHWLIQSCQVIYNHYFQEEIVDYSWEVLNTIKYALSNIICRVYIGGRISLDGDVFLKSAESVKILNYFSIMTHNQFKNTCRDIWIMKDGIEENLNIFEFRNALLNYSQTIIFNLMNLTEFLHKCTDQNNLRLLSFSLTSPNVRQSETFRVKMPTSVFIKYLKNLSPRKVKDFVKNECDLLKALFSLIDYTEEEALLITEYLINLFKSFVVDVDHTCFIYEARFSIANILCQIWPTCEICSTIKLLVSTESGEDRNNTTSSSLESICDAISQLPNDLSKLSTPLSKETTNSDLYGAILNCLSNSIFDLIYDTDICRDVPIRNIIEKKLIEMHFFAIENNNSEMINSINLSEYITMAFSKHLVKVCEDDKFFRSLCRLLEPILPIGEYTFFQSFFEGITHIQTNERRKAIRQLNEDLQNMSGDNNNNTLIVKYILPIVLRFLLLNSASSTDFDYLLFELSSNLLLTICDLFYRDDTNFNIANIYQTIIRVGVKHRVKKEVHLTINFKHFVTLLFKLINYIPKDEEIRNNIAKYIMTNLIDIDLSESFFGKAKKDKTWKQPHKSSAQSKSILCTISSIPIVLGIQNRNQNFISDNLTRYILLLVLASRNRIYDFRSIARQSLENVIKYFSSAEYIKLILSNSLANVKDNVGGFLFVSIIANCYSILSGVAYPNQAFQTPESAVDVINEVAAVLSHHYIESKNMYGDNMAIENMKKTCPEFGKVNSVYIPLILNRLIDFALSVSSDDTLHTFSLNEDNLTIGSNLKNSSISIKLSVMDYLIYKLMNILPIGDLELFNKFENTALSPLLTALGKLKESSGISNNFAILVLRFIETHCINLDILHRRQRIITDSKTEMEEVIVDDDLLYLFPQVFKKSKNQEGHHFRQKQRDSTFTIQENSLSNYASRNSQNYAKTQLDKNDSIRAVYQSAYTSAWLNIILNFIKKSTNQSIDSNVFPFLLRIFSAKSAASLDINDKVLRFLKDNFHALKERPDFALFFKGVLKHIVRVLIDTNVSLNISAYSMAQSRSSDLLSHICLCHDVLLKGLFISQSHNEEEDEENETMTSLFITDDELIDSILTYISSKMNEFDTINSVTSESILKLLIKTFRSVRHRFNKINFTFEDFQKNNYMDNLHSGDTLSILLKFYEIHGDMKSILFGQEETGSSVDSVASVLSKNAVKLGVSFYVEFFRYSQFSITALLNIFKQVLTPLTRITLTNIGYIESSILFLNRAFQLINIDNDEIKLLCLLTILDCICKCQCNLSSRHEAKESLAPLFIQIWHHLENKIDLLNIVYNGWSDDSQWYLIWGIFCIYKIYTLNNNNCEFPSEIVNFFIDQLNPDSYYSEHFVSIGLDLIPFVNNHKFTKLIESHLLLTDQNALDILNETADNNNELIGQIDIVKLIHNIETDKIINIFKNELFINNKYYKSLSIQDNFIETNGPLISPILIEKFNGNLNSVLSKLNVFMNSSNVHSNLKDHIFKCLIYLKLCFLYWSNIQDDFDLSINYLKNENINDLSVGFLNSVTLSFIYRLTKVGIADLPEVSRINNLEDVAALKNTPGVQLGYIANVASFYYDEITSSFYKGDLALLHSFISSIESHAMEKKAKMKVDKIRKRVEASPAEINRLHERKRAKASVHRKKSRNVKLLQAKGVLR